MYYFYFQEIFLFFKRKKLGSKTKNKKQINKTNLKSILIYGFTWAVVSIFFTDLLLYFFIYNLNGSYLLRKATLLYYLLTLAFSPLVGLVYWYFKNKEKTKRN